jgi:hypothetical protein
MHLYRVHYVFRGPNGAAPQEKVVYVVAPNDVAACNYINATPGNETMSANIHVRNVEIAERKADAPSNLEVQNVREKLHRR